MGLLKRIAEALERIADALEHQCLEDDYAQDFGAGGTLDDD